MTWISFVCLLAISSSAFGRYVSYGGYGSGSVQPQASSMNIVRDFTSQQSQQPFLTQVTQQSQQPLISQVSQHTGYGQQKPQTFIQTQQEDIQEQSSLQQPIQSSYGSSFVAPQMIRKPFIQADLGYGKNQLGLQQRTYASPQQLLLDQQQQLQQKIEESTIVTEADNLCRGQRAETVIPLDNGRRFVVCVDDGKGQEQYCPKGLLYHTESRRCERKLGPLENPCSSQPCLNGGQCVQTEVSSYQCQCAPGFDGKTCELDATVCQTQQPCGQSSDAKCQSFRWGAALQHICILQGGRAYGLTASQAQPNPCNGVDGTFPLAFSDKGFIMCDGESMFVESCPGGTIWDDLNKSCVWPDMQGVISFDEKSVTLQGYGQSINTLPVQRSMNSQYGGYSQIKTPVTQIITQQKSIPLVQQQDRLSSYGTQQDRLSGYGSQQQIKFPVQQQIQLPVQQQREDEDEQRQTTILVQQPTRVLQQDRVEQLQFPQTSQYGSQQTTSQYGSQQPIRVLQQDRVEQLQFPQTSQYGSQQTTSQYGSQQPIRVLQQDRVEQQQLQFPQTSQYGSQQSMIKSHGFQQPMQRQQDIVLPVHHQKQQYSGY